MAESNSNTPATDENKLTLAKDRYKFIRALGRGSYGEVWLVSPLESSHGSKAKPRRCVLKRVSIPPSKSNDDEIKELKAAEREACLLSSLKHPNIVAYIESFRSRDHHLNIVMAFCEGGDLYTKLKLRKKQLLNETQILDWFIQITLALQYMHDRSILHRDLKTQNIFLTKGEIIKVGDLGIARILENNGADLATTVIGTPYYMSPEIFSNQPYGQKSDIWALGCCVYEMATLEHAFKAGDISSLVLKVVRGQTPTLPSADAYSKELITLINAMLSKEADNRPTAKEILLNSYVKSHISRLYKKTRERCQPYLANSSIDSATSVSSSHDAEHHSMPPIPKPRSAHLVHNDEEPNERSAPSTPPMSQSRARRQKQKVTASNHDDSKPPTPPSSSSIHHDNEEKQDIDDINRKFIAKVQQNDTIARLRRDSPQLSPVPHSSESVSNPLTSSARQRRRDRMQSSTTSSTVTSSVTVEEEPPSPIVAAATPVYDRSISNDSQIDAVEEERKAKRDMDDFLHQLDATLRLPNSSAQPVEKEELTTMFDRTMMNTSKIAERRDALRENCLKDMTANKLQQVMDVLDLVGDTDIKEKLIEILGPDLYDEYCAQIYSLKYYESSLITRQ